MEILLTIAFNQASPKRENEKHRLQFFASSEAYTPRKLAISELLASDERQMKKSLEIYSTDYKKLDVTLPDQTPSA